MHAGARRVVDRVHLAAFGALVCLAPFLAAVLMVLSLLRDGLRQVGATGATFGRGAVAGGARVAARVTDGARARVSRFADGLPFAAYSALARAAMVVRDVGAAGATFGRGAVARAAGVASRAGGGARSRGSRVLHALPFAGYAALARAVTVLVACFALLEMSARMLRQIGATVGVVAGRVVWAASRVGGPLRSALASRARRTAADAGDALAAAAVRLVYQIPVALEGARAGRAWLGAAAHRGLSANGPLSAAVAIVIFLIATTQGPLERANLPIADDPTPRVASVVPTEVLEPAVVRPVGAELDDPSLTEERRLAAVEEMGRDARDAATDALLAQAENPSVVVAMASVRALRGRPCARVGSLLAGRLAHPEWQRRAWAAKVLGENGCLAAAPELRRRLRNEPDPRVRAQIVTALATLARGTPG